MRNIIVATLLIAILFGSPTFVEGVSIVATRGVLVAQGESAPLFEQRANVRHDPASLTKIMTVVLALEQGSLDSEVIMSERAVAVGGSSLNARAGDKFTLRDLVYAAMLISANDASNAIALHIGGTLEDFNAMMNNRAVALGMPNSQFRNAHGMPEDAHFSTAMDLAVLGLHAASLPVFMEIAGTRRFVMNNGRVLHNQNRMLDESRGVLGGKTGYTDEAGQCLLLIAERSGLTLVSVVLGSAGGSLWTDSAALLNFGFANYSRQVLVTKRQTMGLYPIPLSGEVILVAKGGLSRIVRTAEQRNIIPEFVLHMKNNLWPPLVPGQQLGEVIVSAAGSEIGRVGLTVPTYVPLFTWSRLGASVGALVVMIGAFKTRRRWLR